MGYFENQSTDHSHGSSLKRHNGRMYTHRTRCFGVELNIYASSKDSLFLSNTILVVKEYPYICESIRTQADYEYTFCVESPVDKAYSIIYYKQVDGTQIMLFVNFIVLWGTLKINRRIILMAPL